MIEWHWVEQEGLPTEPGLYLLAGVNKCPHCDEPAPDENVMQCGLIAGHWLDNAAIPAEVDVCSVYAWARNPHMPPRKPRGARFTNMLPVTIGDGDGGARFIPVPLERGLLA